MLWKSEFSQQLPSRRDRPAHMNKTLAIDLSGKGCLHNRKIHLYYPDRIKISVQSNRTIWPFSPGGVEYVERSENTLGKIVMVCNRELELSTDERKQVSGV
ncbi:hypothetical protein JTB14_034874 [Gonioctena quinquepunctata]|nr:hypothetical protein JTB14_034874 [Gonioctena quinquepunctata]